MLLEIPDRTVDGIGTGRVGLNSRPFRRTSRQESRSVSPADIRRKRDTPYMSPGISPLPTTQPQLEGAQKLIPLREPPLGVPRSPSPLSSPNRTDPLPPPPANLPTPQGILRAERNFEFPGEVSDDSYSTASPSFDTDDVMEESAGERALGTITSSARDNVNFGSRFRDPLSPSLATRSPARPLANLPRPHSSGESTANSVQRFQDQSYQQQFQGSGFLGAGERGAEARRDYHPFRTGNGRGDSEIGQSAVNILGEAVIYSGSDDGYEERFSGKKATSSAKSNENFGLGCRDSVDFSKASRAFGRMKGKAWKSSDTYSPVNSTISKDKTMGESVRQAELLAHFGQKIKPCVFTSVQREEDEKSEAIEKLEELVGEANTTAEKRIAETTTKMAVTDKTKAEQTNLGPARLYLGNLPEDSA